MQRIHRALFVSLTVMALLSVSLRAQAESPTESSGGRWYGWQTLIVTGSSLATLPLAPLTGGYSGIASGGGLMLGGPIVHWANGNVGRGFASLGLNAGGAVVGGAIGVGAGVAADNGEGVWLIYGGLIGSLIGLTTANIIDATVLAYGPRGSADYGLRLGPRKAITLLPTANIQPGRASFGVMGTF